MGCEPGQMGFLSLHQVVETGPKHFILELPGWMGAALCYFDDTGGLRHTCHLPPSWLIFGKQFAAKPHAHSREKEKASCYLFFFFFFLFLTVFEEVSTNSPVADLKDVGPTEILFLTTEISRILWSIYFVRKPTFLFLLIVRVSFLIP